MNTDAVALQSSATRFSVTIETIQHSSHLNKNLHHILDAFGKDDYDAQGPDNLDPDALDVDFGAANEIIDSSSHLRTRIVTDLLDGIASDQHVNRESNHHLMNSHMAFITSPSRVLPLTLDQYTSIYFTSIKTHYFVE
ncbi:hypothetical protein ACHAW6_006996 [Cyclotella cf. meneghiniana]